MQEITRAEELVAAAGRQGVDLANVEAALIRGYIESHDYSLLLGEGFSLTLHDRSDGDNNENDEAQTIRDIIELCKELNEELLLDAHSATERDDDGIFELQKDALIIERLLQRAKETVKPTLRRYNVVVIEHYKKSVPVLAASWAEAKMEVEGMWKEGGITMSSADFAGMTTTSGV